MTIRALVMKLHFSLSSAYCVVTFTKLGNMSESRVKINCCQFPRATSRILKSVTRNLYIVGKARYLQSYTTFQFHLISVQKGIFLYTEWIHCLHCAGLTDSIILKANMT